MNKKIFKTFKTDRLLRNFDGIPIGKVVLVGEYIEGENISIAVMTVFSNTNKSVKDIDFYVDGTRYRTPNDLPKGKITVSQSKLLVNSFYLVKV